MGLVRNSAVTGLVLFAWPLLAQPAPEPVPTAPPAAVAPAPTDAATAVPPVEEVASAAPAPVSAPPESASPEPAIASDPSPADRLIDLHFFGNRTGVVSFGPTSYAGMAVGGKMDLGLALQSTPTENLRLAGQVFIDAEHQNLLAVDKVDVSIDYLFAEVRQSDAVRGLFGYVRVPGGWYSNVLNVGMARPFNLLPLSVYGPGGVLGRTYRGLGLRGVLPVSNDWTFDYHLYLGPTNTIDDRTTLEVQRPGYVAPATDDASPILKRFNADGGNAGFRGVLEWSEGLSIAAAGELRLSEEKRFAAGYTDGYLSLQLQYVRDVFTLRTEAYHVTVLGLKRELVGYAEVSADLLPWFGLAGRIDYDRILPADGVLPASSPRLLEHTDLGLALTFTLGSWFRIRADYHYIRGNRFVYDVAAVRRDGAAAVMPSDSQVVLIGFSFGI